MNALKFITSYKQAETITNKDYPRYSFGIITYNGIDLWIAYNHRTHKPLMFNLTKLTKSLKEGLASISSTAHSFIRYNREQIESRQNDFMEVRGKGTQKYGGWYVSLKWLDRICFHAAGFNGADWFDGKSDWYGDLFYGHVYLVQPPEYHGTNVFKIGKTGQSDREMKRRWIKYVNDAGESGINGLDILGLVAVKNTSLSENDAKVYYKLDKRIHFLPGANGKDTEYFEVLDVEPEEAANIVVEKFEHMCNEFTQENKLQSCDDVIETFEPGTHVFHYECYKKE